MATRSLTMSQSYDRSSLVATSSEAGTLTFLQRTLYVMGGLALAAVAAKPRPNPALSIVALGAGAYLAWRGAEGTCPVKAAIEDHTA
jgi:uncharacterized membrane protein